MPLIDHLITESQHFINEVSSKKQEILIKKILHLLLSDTVSLSIMEETIDILDFPMDGIKMYTIAKNPSEALGKYHYNKMKDLVEEYDNRYSIYQLVKFSYLLDHLFDDFVKNIDPTKNLKYANWIIDTVLDYFIEAPLKGGIPENANDVVDMKGVKKYVQDKEKLREYLTLYHEAKRKNELPDEYRDINQLPDVLDDPMSYRNIEDPIKILYNTVKKFMVEQQGNTFDLIDAKLTKKKDYEVISEGSYDYNVYVPLNQKSASIMGHKTQWCTTYGGECTNIDWRSRTSYFTDYKTLVILINRENPDKKKQFAFYEDEFMDQDDVPVDMREFWFDNPKLMRDIMKFDDFYDGEYQILHGIEDWLATQGEEFLGDIITSGMGDTFDDIYTMLKWKAPSSLTDNKNSRDYYKVIYEDHHTESLIEYNNIEILFDIFSIDFNEEVDTIDEILKAWLRTSIKYEYEYDGMYRLELDMEYTQAWICDYMLDTNIFPKVY